MNHEPSPGSAPRGSIELSGLRQTYGGQGGLQALDLHIEAGEFFTILGPSGCGKTTTLMLLAGFSQPESGAIRIDGRDVAAIPPQARDIGLVFQHYALFPHMTVAENLAFPLEMRRIPRPEIERRVEEVLRLTHLDDASRLPGQLSGGQQQRVAVARAIIFGPPVLLMDEPLGALDRKLRAHMQAELRALQRRLGLTMVYVTHDQDEAMSMSDRVAILNQGRLEQVGTPRELYEQPATLFVAQFLGDNNQLPAQIQADGQARLHAGHVWRPAHGEAEPGQQVIATLRPERLSLRPAGGGRTQAVVAEHVFLGDRHEYQLDSASLGRVLLRGANQRDAPLPATGSTVGLDWDDADLRLFPAP